MLAAIPALPIAFLAGLVSFLSPCVFPLVPAYAAYLSGQAGRPALAAATATGPTAAQDAGRVPVLANGAAFVLGFSVVFIAFFYLLEAVEVRLFVEHRHAINVIAGVVVIAMAVQTMGLFRIGWLMRDRRVHLLPSPGMAGAFLLGVTFAAGWSPCLGPTLGAILQVAVNGGFGGLPLMLVYCLGLAVPFLVVAVLCDRLQGPIRAVNRHLGVINLVAGGLLLVFGLLLAFDRLTVLSTLSPSSPFDL